MAKNKQKAPTQQQTTKKLDLSDRRKVERFVVRTGVSDPINRKSWIRTPNDGILSRYRHMADRIIFSSEQK